MAVECCLGICCVEVCVAWVAGCLLDKKRGSVTALWCRSAACVVCMKGVDARGVWLYG